MGQHPGMRGVLVGSSTLLAGMAVWWLTEKLSQELWHQEVQVCYISISCSLSSKYKPFFCLWLSALWNSACGRKPVKQCFATTVCLQSSTMTHRHPFVFKQHLCIKSTLLYLHNVQAELLSWGSWYFSSAAGLSSATGWFDPRKVLGSEEQRTWKEGSGRRDFSHAEEPTILVSHKKLRIT